MKLNIPLKLTAIAICALAFLGGREALAVVEAPVLSPPGGTFFDFVDITMSTTTPGAAIYYTTDGTDPQLTPFVYDPMFITEFDETTTVRAIAFLGGVYSAETVATYTIVPSPTPTIKLIGKKSLKTTRPTMTIRGTSANAQEIDYAIDDGDFKVAKGLAKWSFKTRFRPGKHLVYIYAVGENDDSNTLTVKVIYVTKR